MLSTSICSAPQESQKSQIHPVLSYPGDNPLTSRLKLATFFVRNARYVTHIALNRLLNFLRHSDIGGEPSDFPALFPIRPIHTHPQARRAGTMTPPTSSTCTQTPLMDLVRQRECLSMSHAARMQDLGRIPKSEHCA